MTDKIDTSPEAVEQLAEVLDSRRRSNTGYDIKRGAETLLALSARVSELEAANDAAEKSYRISDNGNLWRFWSDKARETSSKFDALKKRAEAAEARFIEQRDSLVSVTKKLAKTEARLAEVIKKWSAAESEAYDLRADLVQQATKGAM